MTNTHEIKPEILFVHGSWHSPVHFVRVRQIFEDAGYATSCPLQPSVGSLPPIALKEDAQCIREELNRLIDDEGRNVIVVAHSYGGMVTSEGVDQAFAKKKRVSDGKQGGVLHLLYMCAFMLPIDTSLADAFGGEIPPFMPVDDQDRCIMLEPEKRFYQDLPVEEQNHWVSQLQKCPVATQTTALTQVAYIHHPVTYMYCTEDAALFYPIQQMMVKNASEANGINISTASCSSSHSPFLSMPERVLEVVQGIAL